MSLQRFSFIGAFVLVALALPSIALAQSPPPGYIFNLATVHPSVLSAYQPFSTSFMADNSTMFVSFAFREVPAFLAFDDASVTKSGSSTNLLADPGFESAVLGQNCNHSNSLGCPPGWSAWIQPVDVSAIGQVATSADHYGCGSNGPNTGSAYWCDGSVEGYDAVFQQLNGLSVGSTYNVNWFVGDNSGSGITNPTIDMLVYAGDTIPVGTINIGGGVPEPGALGLMGFGLSALGLMVARKRKA